MYVTHSFFNNAFSLFKQDTPLLTAQQKKIFLIASMIFGGLLVCCMLFRKSKAMWIKAENMARQFEKAEEARNLFAEKCALRLKAKKSGFCSTNFGSLTHLKIYRMAEKASPLQISAIMEGAIDSKDKSKIQAVILAILTQVENPICSHSLKEKYVDKLKKAFAILPEDLLLEILTEVQHSPTAPQPHLLHIKELKLELLLSYKKELFLSQAIISKAQEIVDLSNDLENQTKHLPRFVFA